MIIGGPGSDTITGGDGDDVIDARDGTVDTVPCGAGDDVAKLDENDVIADATGESPNGSCETVLRGDPDSTTDPDHRTGGNCPRHGDDSSSGSEDTTSDSQSGR